MAAATFGGPLTVQAVARNITTLLASLNGVREFFSEGVLRADVANAGTVWIGGSNVTTTTNQMGFIRAGDALTLNLNIFMTTDQIYLIGTPADKVYFLGLAR